MAPAMADLARGPAADANISLAHVPEKWRPVFRKGHAPVNESRAHPDPTQPGCALERIAVAQVAAIGDDARDQGALPLVGDQRLDQIDLVHGDKLQDFVSHLARGVARQLIDDLQMLGRLDRKSTRLNSSH